jgi:hypothetical protein
MSQQSVVETPSGFFKSLFDFSFRSYVTPQIIRILYVLSLAGIAIWALAFLAMIFSTFNDPFTPVGLSVLMLLLWPIGVLFAVIYARVLLEFLSVVFHIGEAADATARNTGPTGGRPPSPGHGGGAAPRPGGEGGPPPAGPAGGAPGPGPGGAPPPGPPGRQG